LFFETGRMAYVGQGNKRSRPASARTLGSSLNSNGTDPTVMDAQKHDNHSDIGITATGARAMFLDGQQSGACFSWESFNKFPSDPIPDAALTTRTQFDCRLPGAPVDTLKSIEFQITIQNPTGLVMHFCDPSVWFSQKEELLDGSTSSNVSYEIQNYLTKMCRISDEDRAIYGKGLNFNYETNRTIVGSNYRLNNYDLPPTGIFNLGAGAIKTYYVNFDDYIAKAHIFMPSLTVEPRYRFYTGNNIQTTTSPGLAGNPTLLSVNTMQRGVKYRDTLRTQLKSMYSNRDSVCRAVVWERQTIAANITSLQESQDKQLTALVGKYSHLMFVVTQAGPVQNQIYSDYLAADAVNGTYWKKLQDITLLDSNQNPWNYVKTESAYYKNVVWGSHWRSALPFEKEIICIPFSTAAQNTQDFGQDLGSAVLDGNWTLRFTPVTDTDNVITANMGVTVIALGARFCEITQTRAGALTFRKLN